MKEKKKTIVSIYMITFNKISKIWRDVGNIHLNIKELKLSHSLLPEIYIVQS